MSAFIDLTGRRFGRLLVMQATSKKKLTGRYILEMRM